MKIYNVSIHDREAGKNDTVNLAVLETDAEKKSYDAGDYDALFKSSGYEDEDIFYYIRSEEIPAGNNGQILTGDTYDFITVLVVNTLEYQSH